MKRQNLAGWCQPRTAIIVSTNFLFSKVCWQCFVLSAQVNFLFHTLNFHWRWRWCNRIQAIFLNLFYFTWTVLELCWRLKIRKAAQCIFVRFFASTHKIGIFRIPIHVGQALVSLGVNQALSHHSSHGRPQRWEIMEQLEKQVSGLDHLKKNKTSWL